MKFQGQELNLLPEQEEINLTLGISYERAELIVNTMADLLNKMVANDQRPTIVDLLNLPVIDLESAGELVLAASMAGTMVTMAVGVQEILKASVE